MPVRVSENRLLQYPTPYEVSIGDKMQFIAMIAGKKVSYPHPATFVISQRTGHRPFSLVSSKPDIDSALAKFYRSVQGGTTTRLSATVNGKLTHLFKQVGA